jgi:signal peptidase I
MPIQLQEFLIGIESEEQSAKCALFAEVVSRHGAAKLKAWGTSMVPAILPGDTLVVEHQQISGLAAGDVAVYLRAGRLFAHRVLEVVNEPDAALITRGDAMDCDDPPVLAHEVIGRVTSIAPGPRLTRHVRRGLSALRNVAAALFLLQA